MELMTKEAFRVALEQEVKGRHSQASPFSAAWASGALSKEHFAHWVEQHYHYVGYFAEYLGYVYGNCDNKDAQDFLLQNMWEEELGGTRHTDLLIRFGEACGTTREQVLHAELLPTTLGVQSWCYAMAMRKHFAVATAGLVVGLESQVPGIYRRQLPPLLETYGFTEEETEFFDLHIVSDEVHGERGYQIVLENATTPELQQECLAAVRQATSLRWAYMDGIYRAFVQKEAVPTSA